LSPRKVGATFIGELEVKEMMPDFLLPLETLCDTGCLWKPLLAQFGLAGFGFSLTNPAPFAIIMSFSIAFGVPVFSFSLLEVPP
jgi:hypothetical protein